VVVHDEEPENRGEARLDQGWHLSWWLIRPWCRSRVTPSYALRDVPPVEVFLRPWQRFPRRSGIGTPRHPALIVLGLAAGRGRSRRHDRESCAELRRA
jgi:hypothetical protein